MTEAEIIASGIPSSWACLDCGVNTAPGCPNASQMVQAFKALALNLEATKMTFNAETSEVYMVKTPVWRAAGNVGGCLCIGCLEKRISRTLKPKDFDRKNPINQFPGTKRLQERRDG